LRNSFSPRPKYASCHRTFSARAGAVLVSGVFELLGAVGLLGPPTPVRRLTRDQKIRTDARKKSASKKEIS
jgi:hypothetical protein